MTTEELLKPRYSVIAMYPQSEFKVGDILIQHKAGGYFIGGTDAYDNTIQTFEHDIYGYPHLFKKLEWWEDRKPEEMPAFLKNNEFVFKCQNWTFLLNKFDNEIEWTATATFKNGGKKRTYINFKYLLPATEEEFLNQNK